MGQLPVLNRLVEHGLVIAEPANQGFLYRLNREHVLGEPILMVVRARTTILERLGEAVTVLRPQPVHVSVFGSFARHEADPTSDIDVLVVTADEDVGEAFDDQLELLARKVLSWTGNRLERVVLSVDRLAEVAAAGEPIVASWQEQAITVFGVPLADLLRPRTRGSARR